MAPNSRFVDVMLPYPVKLFLCLSGLIWEIKYQAKEEIAKELDIKCDGMITVTIYGFRVVSEFTWAAEGKLLNQSKVWCDCKLNGIFDSPFTMVMEVLSPVVKKG